MISIAEVFEDHKEKNTYASTSTSANANIGSSRSSGLYMSQRPPIF